MRWQASEDVKEHLSGLPTPPQPPGDLVRQGAEARIYSVAKSHLSSLPGIACIVKERFVKTYRHPSLDASLSLRRMRAEARQLVKCRQLGLPVPALLMVDMARRQLWMEDVCSPHGMSLGQWFRKVLDLDSPALYLKKMAEDLGRLLAKMHANNIIHGDLTTANILVKMETSEDKFGNYLLYLIDFGLSSINHRVAANFRDEEIAVDLYVFERALISALAKRQSGEGFDFTPEFFKAVLSAYKVAYPEEALKRTVQKSNTIESDEVSIKKRKKKERKSMALATTIEDARNEANGILEMLKEVKSRGRKRTMIG